AGGGAAAGAHGRRGGAAGVVGGGGIGAAPGSARAKRALGSGRAERALGSASLGSAAASPRLGSAPAAPALEVEMPGARITHGRAAKHSRGAAGAAEPRAEGPEPSGRRPRSLARACGA